MYVGSTRTMFMQENRCELDADQVTNSYREKVVIA